MNNDSKRIKVSVIIPVHNAERFLHRCIDSLKKQTLESLEFIFVNDCSTDKSLEIIREFAEQDSRVIIIINDKNIGEGGSRNRGIQAASGLYINSIDPDDWVASDFYELLFKKAISDNYDIVKGTRIRIDEITGEEILPRSTLNVKLKRNRKKSTPLFSGFTSEHQSAIYAHRLLENMQVYYGSSANACDTTFLLRTCIKAQSFALENKAHYFYLKRAGSATDGYSMRRSNEELKSFQEKIDTILDYGFNEFFNEYLRAHLRGYTTIFCHAFYGCQLSTSDVNTYINQLSTQIHRIPQADKFLSDCWETKALIEERKPLPSTLCVDGNIWRDELLEWVDYTLSPSSRYSKEAFRIFPLVLMRFAHDKRVSRDTKTAFLYFVTIQMRRFCLKDRINLMKYCTGDYLNWIMKKIPFFSLKSTF